MNTKQKSNEPKTGDVLYVNEQLKLELSQKLSPAVDAINGAWDLIKKSFPNAILNRAYIWALLINPDTRDFVHTKVLNDKAQAMGLNCAYIRARQENSLSLEPLSQQNRDDRRLFEVLTRKELKPLTEFLNLMSMGGRNIETYLRIGAIIFDAASGTASEAAHAADLIEYYCTVSIANERERKFVEAFKEAHAAATALGTAYKAMAANVENREARNAISGYPEWSISKILLPHEYGTGKGVYLLADNSLWRALLSFVADGRSNDGPRFFNKNGYPGNAGIEFVYNATGYLPPATPMLRYTYPKLYEGVPYRGNGVAITSSYPNDVEGAVEAIRKDRINGIFLA